MSAPALAAPPAPSDLLEELATANHILFHRGVVDGFGHVSARHPDRPDHFLLARSMAPLLVTAADILLFGPDSEPVAAGQRVYLERYIHGEIYRARPDVMAVVHSHSPAVLPFAIARGAVLRPVCHMGGFLRGGAPRFEIRCCAGDSSDLLVRDRRLGAALAEALGGEAVVLMRGHGSTTVGATLRQAVFRAVYTEVNARLQSESARLGEVEFLTPGEAEAASAANDTQIDRAWALWAMQARNAAAAPG